MALPGSGIVPSGANFNELTAVTRRAFVPKLVVQIYNSSPLIASLLANNQTAQGGVSSVTVPVQGAPLVSSAFSDYSGTFSAPTEQYGMQNAEFNLKVLITPIPYLGMEGILQLNHDVVNRMEARMNDAGNSATDALATALFNNTTNAQSIIGLPGAVDDGTNLVTYGDINRAQNIFWKSKVYNAGSVAPTRANVMQYITGVVKASGERPKFGVMGPGTWQNLANDFIGVEQFRLTPGTAFSDVPEGAQSGFLACSVAGVPIYQDAYCPEGVLYLLNTDYLNMYIHQDAQFNFTGFESMLSNYQLGYVGAVVTVLELVNVKPIASARVGSYNFLTI